jgi:hypothetical protein
MLNPATPPDEDIYLLIAGVAGQIHAALANSKGPQGKSKKSTKKGAVSLPRHYMTRIDSSGSESSSNESPVQNAMFAQVRMDPLPQLSVQRIFCPKSCHALDTSKTRWEHDRFGYHNQCPRIFDEAVVYHTNAIKS